MSKTAFLDALQVARGGIFNQVEVAGQQTRQARAGAGHRRHPDFLPRRQLAPIFFIALKHNARALDVGLQHIEIGRASCRERVCQYVSISVVAVSLKKKIIEEERLNEKS